MTGAGDVPEADHRYRRAIVLGGDLVVVGVERLEEGRMPSAAPPFCTGAGSWSQRVIRAAPWSWGKSIPPTAARARVAIQPHTSPAVAVKGQPAQEAVIG